MFSRSTRRLMVTGVAAVAAAGLLVGCADTGSNETPGDSSTATNSQTVPDVLTGHDKGEFDITIASVAADKSVMRPMQEWYMDEVERRTDGAVMFNRTGPNAIVKDNAQQSTALSGGLAQLLVQVPNYEPTIFTPSSVPEITFSDTDNAAAVTAAYNDLYKSNKDVQAFFDAKGVVPVAVWSVGRDLVGSSVQLSGPQDLNGLTMRTAGTIAAPDLASAGVTPVQVGASDAQSAFTSGLAKAASGAMDFVYAWKLGEYLPYWYDTGLGVYSEFAMYWSKDQWDAFPDDIKAILTDINDKAVASGQYAKVWRDGYTTSPMDSSASTHYIGTTEECTAIQAMSNVKSMSTWDDKAIGDFKALGATTKDGHFATNDELWLKNSTAAGLTNPQGVLSDFRSAYTKYASQFPDFATDAVTTCINSFK